MFLSLTLRHEAPSKGDFVNLMNRLDEHLGATWSPPGRRDILDLHKARNSAQHGAVLPDPALMPVWRDAVDVFVRSLVNAAYGVNLDDVLLADAIGDPRLKSDMESIEQMLTDSRHAEAFAAAVTLLSRGRARWRDQQQDAYGWMPVSDPVDELPDRLDASNRGTDYADVSVFADDLGEYHWLLATRRQVANGVSVAEDDARRASLFVYHWLLRWQHFDVRYPRDRWRAAYAELAPPATYSLDGEQEATSLLALTFVARIELAGREWRKVDAVVANIPERGRSDWGADMAGALAKAAQRLGLTSSENAAFGHVVSSTADPILGRFTFLVSPEIEAAAVATLLSATIANASAQYEVRQRSAADLTKRLEDARRAIAPAFENDSLGLFGPPSITTEVRRSGEVFLVRVPVNGSSPEIVHFIEIFRGVGGTLAGAMLEDSEIMFIADDDPKRQQEEVMAAVSGCIAHAEHLRNRVHEQQTADVAFASALRDRIGPQHR
jgi:hypothetical protein